MSTPATRSPQKYDTCSGCGGVKSKVSQFCMKCYKGMAVGPNSPHWKGGRESFCPDCGSRKRKESKRCRPCSYIAKRRFTDPEHVYGREWQRQFRLTPEGKKHVLRMNLKKFNLTPEQYWKMVEDRSGLCDVCHNPEETFRRGNRLRLSIDHDHTCCPGSDRSCGKCIRGLLCNNCNRALGLVGDSVERVESMLAYLKVYELKEVMPYVHEES